MKVCLGLKRLLKIVGGKEWIGRTTLRSGVTHYNSISKISSGVIREIFFPQSERWCGFELVFKPLNDSQIYLVYDVHVLSSVASSFGRVVLSEKHIQHIVYTYPFEGHSIWTCCTPTWFPRHSTVLGKGTVSWRSPCRKYRAWTAPQWPSRSCQACGTTLLRHSRCTPPRAYPDGRSRWSMPCRPGTEPRARNSPPQIAMSWGLFGILLSLPAHCDSDLMSTRAGARCRSTASRWCQWHPCSGAFRGHHRWTGHQRQYLPLREVWPPSAFRSGSRYTASVRTCCPTI